MAEEAQQPQDTSSKDPTTPPNTELNHDDWETSCQNARNWSPARKTFTTALVSVIGFTWYNQFPNLFQIHPKGQ